MGINIGEAAVEVILDLKRMAAALKAMRLKVAKEMKRAAEDGKRAFAKGLRGIAKAAKWAALGVGAVSTALGAGAAIALHASNQINTAMANVASLGSEAAAHVGEWKGELQNLSVQMGKTTDDLAGGLYQVVSAFGAADDTMQVLAINAKAATAGLAQTTDAINLTSAVTKAYGDTSAGAVQQVADLALKTVQLGQTTFPELAQSIGRVTPLAASLGLSMQDLFAVMATATGVTGNAAEVSTQMRSALSALMAPTDALSKLYKKLGYANGQAMLKALGFGGAMKAIVEAAKKSGRPLQDYIGQVRGQTLALALANGLSEQYTEKLHEMAHAAGATDEAFRAQTQGIAGVAFRLKQLKQRAVMFVQKVGDAVAPLLGLALDMFVPAFDKAAKAVEAVVTAFHDMLTGSKSFAEIHDSLTRVFGDELGSKIFGFLDGIRQLVDGLRNGGLMGDRFRDALERVAGSGAVEAFDNIAAAVGAAREGISQLWGTALSFITNVVVPFVQEHDKAIVAAILAIGAALGTLAVLSTIAGLVAAIANPLTLVLGLIGLLTAAWVEDWGGIREKTAVVIEHLKAAWFVVKTWFTVIIPAALGYLGSVFVAKWNEMKANFEIAKSGLVRGFRTVKGYLGEKLTSAVGTLKGKFGDFATALKTEFLVAWGKLKDALEWARKNIPGVDLVFQGLKLTFDGMKEAIKLAWQWLKQLADWLGRIDIPDWLKRHSPAPIELSLMGMREHLSSLASRELPQFSRGLDALERLRPAMAATQYFSSEQHITVHAPGLDASALVNILRAERVLGVNVEAI